ncbi:hypothetical protein IAR50_003459 [Cryptococcus sp. DSM 104548]
MPPQPLEGFVPPQYLPHLSPQSQYPQGQLHSPLPYYATFAPQSQPPVRPPVYRHDSFNVSSAESGPFPLYCPTPNLTSVYPSSRSTSCYSDGSILFTPQDMPIHFPPEYSNSVQKRRHTYLEDDSHFADPFAKPNTTSAFYGGGGEGPYIVPDSRVFSEPLEMSRHRHSIAPDDGDRATSFEEAKTVPMGGMLRLAEEDSSEGSAKRVKLATSPSAPDVPLVARRTRSIQACDHCRRRKARCVGSDPCQRCAKSKRPCVFSPIHLTRPSSSRSSAPRRPSGLATTTPIATTSPIRRHSISSPIAPSSAPHPSHLSIKHGSGEPLRVPSQASQVSDGTGLGLQLHPAMTSASPDPFSSSSPYPPVPHHSRYTYYNSAGPPGTEFPQGLARSGLGLGLSLAGPRGYESYEPDSGEDTAWTTAAGAVSGGIKSSSARPGSSGHMGNDGQALWTC